MGAPTHPTTRLVVIGLAAAAVLCSLPVGGAYTYVTGQQVSWSWYATAQTSTSGQALSPAPATTGAEYFTAPGAGAASGTMDTAGRLQGNTAAGLVFESEPLNATLYLNLTRTPTVKVFVGWTGGEYSEDKSLIRVELFIGPERVASIDSAVGAKVTGTNYFHLQALAPTAGSFWPSYEVAKLPAGQTLRLIVTHLGGLGDLRVATKGTGPAATNVQTQIVMVGYLVDPLSGALWLKDGFLTADPTALLPTQEPTETSPSAAGGWLFLPFLPALGRRRGMVGVAALLLVALSGCLGGSGSSSGTGLTGGAQPSVSETQEARDDLREAGHGAIEGIVRDDLGLPSKGTHVAIPKTNLFTDTNAKGEFRFPNVTAGTFLLRVDATGFSPLERDITVEAGSVLKLQIFLAKDKSGNQNLDRHRHDEWLGELSVPLIDDEFLPGSTSGLQTSADGYNCVTGYSACAFNFYVPVGKVVRPGATRVEVKITLPESGYRDKEVSLVVGTGVKTKYFGARGSGIPFNVAFFPDEADPGHQKFSRWQFTAHLRGGNTYSQTSYGGLVGWPAYTTGGLAKVEVTAFKGVVPYEKPHTDPWKTKTKVTVLSASFSTSTTYTDYPYDATQSKQDAALVPVGTKEIRGSLKTTLQYNQGPSIADWDLYYKTADIPPQLWRGNLKKATLTPNATSGGFDFKIEVKTGEEDPIYATGGNWDFFLDDKSEPTKVGTVTTSVGAIRNMYTTTTVTATAYKDPAWTVS